MIAPSRVTSMSNFKFLNFKKEADNKPPFGWGHQCWYLEQVLKQWHLNPCGSVLHLGSAIYNENLLYEGSYEKLLIKFGFQGRFVGIDSVPGKGVDLVLDLHKEFDILKSKNPDGFDMIICTSMLEHDVAPQETIKFLGQVLKDDGILCITAPSVQRAHGTVGVYGTYQNFLPDFFYYCARQGGLQVIDESFIYMTAGGDVYSAASVRHHETPEEVRSVNGDLDNVDFLNIPRIKSIKKSIISESSGLRLPLLPIVGSLYWLLQKLSPTFARIWKHDTVYFTNDMALCMKKAVKGEYKND